MLIQNPDRKSINSWFGPHYIPNGPNRYIRTFHPTAEYIFFSGAHETFSRTNHMSGHKTSLKLSYIEITPCIFCDCNGMKSITTNNGKICKYVKLRQHILKQPLSQRENQTGIQKVCQTKENENTRNVVLRGKLTLIKTYIQKKRKISNNPSRN